MSETGTIAVAGRNLVRSDSRVNHHPAPRRFEIPENVAVVRAQGARPQLSRREEGVLLAWLQCDTKAEVCAALYISAGTVNTHLSRIRAKYNAVGRPAQTKAALLARALQDGLLSLDQL